MTEAEWLTCTDPSRMLEFLRGKSSERKLRLFLVACARLVWDRMTDPVMRNGVEVAEQYAEGLVSGEQLLTSHSDVYGLIASEPSLHAKAERMAGEGHDYTSLLGHALCCGFSEAALARIERMGNWRNSVRLTGSSQPLLLREVFGNPFGQVTIITATLTWKDGTVPKLAQGIYEERAFDRLPILADALEDAGCGDREILDHLRGPGPHVRGCWVLDLLLGKE